MIITKKRSRRTFNIILIVTGLVLTGSFLKISFLSHSFIFGGAYADRPILEFLMYIVISFGAYFFAIEQIRKRRIPEKNSRFAFLWILGIAIVCRIILFPSQLIQETDPYRYIWDGQAMLHGINPYRYSPQQAFTDGVIFAEEKITDVSETFRKINHPKIKTIYPPLAQYIFVVSQWLTPWSLIGWRSMIFAVEIVILFIIALLLQRLGMRKEWILLYGWSPLILKEFSNSLHMDIFAVLFLCIMIYCLARGWISWAVVPLVCATLIKLFSVVLLPVLLVWTWKKAKLKSLWHAGIYLLIGIGFYIPFFNESRSLFEGLSIFSRQWRVNDGLFSIIYLATDMLTQANAVTITLISRGVICVIFTGIALAILQWLWSRSDIFSLGKASLLLLTSLFFLIPMGNPWYATWFFPFLFFLPLRSLVIFSCLVFVYYLDFYCVYHAQSQVFKYMRLFEYGLFFGILKWELWIKKQQSQLLFPLLTNVK